MNVDCLKILILISATTMAKKKANEPILKVTVRSVNLGATTFSPTSLPLPKMVAYKPAGFIISFPDSPWMNNSAINLAAAVNKPINDAGGSINGPFKLVERDGKKIWKFINNATRLHNNDKFSFVVNITLHNGTERQKHVIHSYSVRIANMDISPTQAALIKSILLDYVKKQPNATEALDNLTKLGLKEFFDKNIRSLVVTRKFYKKRPTFSWDD